jgi:isopenicillin-N N-acyltransferase-like protein
MNDTRKIRVLEVGGSFYEMGQQHGRAYQDAIHHFTADRVQLSQTEKWTGRTLSKEAVLALADACIAEHERYSPQLMDELRGMAEVTGLSVGELIINNGFTDFVDVVYSVGDVSAPEANLTPENDIPADNCTAFLVPNNATDDHHGMFGQTWDMHASATPYVILLRGRPDNAPAFLSFTIAGCIGMIGMNEAGIAVGINNIRSTDGQIGVTWNFVVRKILMQKTIDDALACITEAKLAGAHNYMLMDKHGNGYNVEAMPTHQHITPLEHSTLSHTNHCLTERTRRTERERPAASMQSSIDRLQAAGTRLRERPVTPQMLMNLMRTDTICVREKEPLHIESCGAAVMRPATGDFWAVWGLPAENDYEHFEV